MSTPNPYAAPKATVADAASPQQGNFVPGGHAVPAGNGSSWIGLGWRLFKLQPGMWIALMVILFVISLAIAFIPIVGQLALNLLYPVFAAGLMLGCRALEERNRLELAHLFAGFKDRLGALVGVGAIGLVVSLLIVVVVLTLTGVSMFGPMSAGAAPGPEAMAGMALAFLVMLALMLPLFMALWFAAPLVVFHERGALEAMKESFTGCLKNIVPFLLYGLIMLLLAIPATLLLGLGWLVLAPVMVASIYAGYRDIYFTA